MHTDVLVKPHAEMACQFQWRPHNSTDDTVRNEVQTTPCRAYHMSSRKTSFVALNSFSHIQKRRRRKKKLGRSNGWKYLQSILSILRKNPWRQWELTAGISAAEEQAMLGQQVQNCRWDSQLWELGIDGPQRTQEAKPARVRLNISQSEGAHMQ